MILSYVFKRQMDKKMKIPTDGDYARGSYIYAGGTNQSRPTKEKLWK